MYSVVRRDSKVDNFANSLFLLLIIIIIIFIIIAVDVIFVFVMTHKILIALVW